MHARAHMHMATTVDVRVAVSLLVLTETALAFAPYPDDIAVPVSGADAPGKHSECVDTGPYPCEEEGCPDGPKVGGTVTCAQMGHMGLCGHKMKNIYKTLPAGIDPELQVKKACRASCHWCCKDFGPFECTEKGCPHGGRVSCTQLAVFKYCDITFKKLYKNLPEGLRADAKAKEACRVSCGACDELKEKDEL